MENKIDEPAREKINLELSNLNKGINDLQESVMPHILSFIDSCNKILDPELSEHEFVDKIRSLPNDDIKLLRNEYAKSRKKFVRDLAYYKGHVLRRIAFNALKKEIEHREDMSIFIEKPKYVACKRYIPQSSNL